MPFGNPILGGGGALVREAIHSPNYVAGVSGWSIQRSGSAEFADVTVRGGVFISPSISGTVTGSATYDSPTIETGTLDGPTLDGSGEVVASGQLASANYVAGVSGWAIDGAGNAEFNDITARGEIGTGGALVSSNYVDGVSGWAIDGDGDAQFNSAVVRGDLITGPDGAGITEALITAYGGGTFTGTAWGGPDPIGLGVQGTVTQYTDAATMGINWAAYTELRQDILTIEARSYLEIVGNIDYYGTVFTFATALPPTFYTDTDLFVFDGEIQAGTDQAIQIGAGDGFPTNWTTYDGMFHKDLSSGYMMMTNGDLLYIGADTGIYLRPAGNGGGSATFVASGGAVRLTTADLTISGAAAASSLPMARFDANYYTNWENYGGTWGVAYIYRSIDGRVHCEGLVRRVTSASGSPNAILLLSSSTRVVSRRRYYCASSVGLATVDVYVNGQIVTNTSIPANGWINLGGIVFQDT